MGETELDLFRFRPYVYRKVVPQSVDAAWPKPRSGHRVVCDDTDLYLYGGYCPGLSTAHAREMDDDPVWVDSRPLYRELWRYNMASREWRRIPCSRSMPRELASSAACMRAGVVFVFGGSGYPFGTACSNHVYTYDARAVAEPGEEGMRLLTTSGDRPRAMYGQAVLLVGPHLYAVGGTTGFEFSSDVHRLDLRSASWEQMYVCTGARPEEPAGRYRHELAWDGERMYVLGGGTGDTACSFESIHAFHVSERRWEVLETQGDPRWGHPCGRCFHGFVQQGSRVFVMGGNDKGQVLGDVWRLELGTLCWTSLPCHLPQNVYFHSTAVTSSGCLHCFGGVRALQADCTRTADLYTMWLCVPSLEAMCREAVRHYSRHSPLFSRQHLARYGLPKNILTAIFSS